MKRQITRKEFLDTTTRTIVAASAGAIAMAVIPASGDQGGQAGVINPAVAPWPLPYAALDPEDIRKRGHKGYYDGACCYGAFQGIVGALAETVGGPYTSIPPQMMYYGSGGGAGWGTLCGALNGAGAAVSLVMDRTNATAVISELFGWCTTAQFPSDISNDYGTRRLFLVNRYDKPLLPTVAGSPLCHISVTGWCTASGFKATSAERSERCARLTGDVAARTVELMNDFFNARFKPAFVVPKSVASCQGCHGASIGDVQPGVKMECQACHKEKWDHLY